MTSPFTFTPGKAGNAYIDMHYADEIIENFIDPYSEKQVYKILGLRGSGKSVIYSKVLSALREKDDWLVYTVSSGGDPTETLVSLLSQENRYLSVSDEKFSTIGNVEGNLALFKGKVSVTHEVSYKEQFSNEAALKSMIADISKKEINIIIGIDDIAKSKKMIEFLSLIGDMLLDDQNNLYLLCTGTSKNIEDFAGEPHLSFFIRGDRIEVKKLSIPQVSFKYQELLNIDEKAAYKLALFTKGYAYAYQVLGELCFKHESSDINKLTKEFNAIMAGQYDIIWNTLTDAEQNFVRIIVNSSGKCAEIKENMDNPQSYNVLRSRLARKHVINTDERSMISIDLPQFKEYVNEWQS